MPYPPGGSNDVIARVLAQKLTEQTGQPFIVDNRAGAGGNVGAELVARSEPDGYTLLLTAPPALTTNVFLYKKMPFDPTKAAPVTVPIVLVVHPSTGIGSVGARSGLASVDAVRQWQQTIPASTLEVLTSDSYHVGATHPEACARIVRSFFDGATG